MDEPKAQKPRTLGGDKPRSEPGMVRQLDVGTPAGVGMMPLGEGAVQMLGMLPLLTYVKAELPEGSQDVVVEGRNPDPGDCKLEYFWRLRGFG